MWMMLQHDTPDDWVIATGETFSVRNFLEAAFKEVDLNYEDYVLTSENIFDQMKSIIYLAMQKKHIQNLDGLLKLHSMIWFL